MRTEELSKEAEMFRGPGNAYLHVEVVNALDDNGKATVIYGGQEATIITAIYYAIQKLAIDMSADENGVAAHKDIVSSMDLIIKAIKQVSKNFKRGGIKRYQWKERGKDE